MNAIGGYFELESGGGTGYHSDLIRVNTARNAFEYILQTHHYNRVYLPRYCCNALLQPLLKTNTAFSFYDIDEKLEPLFDFDSLTATDAFLYINYFGLKRHCMETLAMKPISLIADNAQAFFDQPLENVSTFYSPRKFFGVPDGAYLQNNGRKLESLPQDQSAARMQHLLLRLEESAEQGFEWYQRNEKLLAELPLRIMSELSMQLLHSIDYEKARLRRRANYEYLGSQLKANNPIHIELGEDTVPMIYPYLTDDPQLRTRLQQNRIYTAAYWPEVLERAEPGSIEVRYTKFLIALPIDQRYGIEDMDRILNYMA